MNVESGLEEYREKTGAALFPPPFGGIGYSTGPLTEAQMAVALGHLREGCGKGHAHNFAVQMDGMLLLTSALGAGCVAEALS